MNVKSQIEGQGENSSNSTSEESPLREEPAKPNDANEREGIFSRHGGKIVVGFLGAIALWFLRNHRGNKARDALKDEVEATCPLEPEEVEELRCANDYPPWTFWRVLESVREAFPSGRTTYPEFVRHVTSRGLLPEPLVLGYLLDRVVFMAATHSGILGAVARGEAPPSTSTSTSTADGDNIAINYGGDSSGAMGTWGTSLSGDSTELDLDFLMVAFSSTVNTTPEERIRQLWEMLRESSDGGRTGGGGGGGEGVIPGEEVEYIPASSVMKMIGLLMATQQVPVSRYSVKDTARVWPVQQYRFATGREVLLKGLQSLHHEEEKKRKGWVERKMAPAYDPESEERLSYELFEKVLRSDAVCAWGECFTWHERDKL